MGHKTPDIKTRRSSSDCVQWNDKDLEWEPGYEQGCKVFKTFTFVNGVLFNSTDETYTSAWFECGPFTNFLLLIDLVVTSNPTDILIDVEFSANEVEGYKYMAGPFGDLRYEDGAGDKKESIGDFVRGKYMRLKLTSSGCDSSNTFLMRIKGVFS